MTAFTLEERERLEREFPEQICWIEGHSYDYGYCQLCGHLDRDYHEEYDLGMFDD